VESPVPASLPEAHRRFLASAVEILSRDARLVGVGAGGSYASDTMDEFSDLDLVLAVELGDYARVLADRRRIAGLLGRLLASFTGEHVGEPRLLICLYEGPLHVDLKFVSLDEAADRVEDLVILWQREGRLAEALARRKPAYPAPDPRWIEERFWTWVHYTATKIGRGELFEAVGCLALLREKVLGPLALARAGGRPSGVRRIEMVAPEFARALRRTVTGYDAADCVNALRACVELYRSVRHRGGEVDVEAERAVMSYVSQMERARGAGFPGPSTTTT
jgi:hypothetical protein